MELWKFKKRRFDRFIYWFSTLKSDQQAGLKGVAMSSIKSKSPEKKLINSNDLNNEMSMLYEELLHSGCNTVYEFISKKTTGKVQ